MIHSSSIDALVLDIAKLSKTLSTLAEVIESVHTQQLAKENTGKKEAPLIKEEQKNQKEQPKDCPSGIEHLNRKEIPVVTMEQVRTVLAEKSQAGLTSKVKSLIESFGASKLSDVNPEEYGELLAAAKEIS